MKKIISLILLTAMLLSLSVCFASCDEVSQEDFEKDAAISLIEAIENSTDEFFSDSQGLAKLFEKAKDEATLNLTYDDQKDDGTKIGATIYSDRGAGKYRVDASIFAEGENMSASLYADRKKIAVASNELFGDGKAYLLDYDTYDSVFFDKLFADLDVDEDARKPFVDAVDAVIDSLKKTAKESKKDFIELVDEICLIFGQTVQEKTEQNIDGKDTEYVVVHYNLTLERVIEVLKKIFTEAYGDLAKAEEAIGRTVDDLVESLQQILGISDTKLVLDFYIDKKENKLSKIVGSGNVGLNGNSSFISYTLELAFNADSLQFRVDIEGDVPSFISMKLSKEDTKTSLKYSFDLDLGSGSKTEHIIDAYISLSEESGFALELSASEKSLFKLSGDYKLSGKGLYLSVDSLTADNETKTGARFEIELSPSAKSVKLPKNAVDIMSLSDEERKALADKLMNNELFD